jgi:hypothetical protein
VNKQPVEEAELLENFGEFPGRIRVTGAGADD